MTKPHATMLLSVLCVICLLVGSFAYFTDRASTQAQATAGTLKLDLSDFTVTPAGDLKPGFGAAISFTLTNTGNKSTDILETLILTSNKAMSATPEFDLYNASDVDLSSGVVVIEPGAQPLAVRTVSNDRKQITYAIPQFTLNGTGTGAEIEQGITTNYKSSTYVLVFRADATNEYQGVTLTLDYEAQAKQHRNTDNDTWDTIQTETVSFAGNDNYPAVPTVPGS